MSGLKPDEKRYAIQRINSFVKETLELLKEEFTTTPKAPSDAAMMRSLREGEIETYSLKRGVTLDTKLRDAFDFSHLEKETNVTDTKGYKVKSKKLQNEAAALRDTVMLGSGETALAMITEFVKKYETKEN